MNLLANQYTKTKSEALKMANRGAVKWVVKKNPTGRSAEMGRINTEHTMDQPEIN